MPASSSIAIPIGRRSHCGHSSVRKIAMPRPTGIAISIAMKEVTSVPYIGPSAPSTGGSDRTPQPLRAQFGKKNRDAKTHRDRDQHRDEGGNQRTVHRAERAEYWRIRSDAAAIAGTVR